MHDTLKVADRLRQGGFSVEQAGTVASVLVDVLARAGILTNLPAATDVGVIRAQIRAELAEAKVRRPNGSAMAALAVQAAAIFWAVLAVSRLSH